MPDIVLSTINAKWIHPSLALRLLKANLGALYERCEILEFALRQPPDEKTGAILAAAPRILGLSVSIWNHTASIGLLKALNEKWNEKPAQRPAVILGGPEVSFLDEKAEIFRYADFVIRGEGEEVFRELCEKLLEKGGISAAVSAARRDTVFINEDAAALDPARLTTAYHLYSDEDVKKKLIYVESVRGCPFGCEFCLSARDKKVRQFPLEPFLAEMENLIDRGARVFKFLDRTFNLEINRSIRIMEFFLERINSPRKGDKPLCVHFEMVPSNFPPPLKEIIRRFPLGSLRLEIGIQTLNSETALLINRAAAEPAGMETELAALKFLRAETNALIHADLIAGLPGENFASFGKGFDRLWQTLRSAGSAPFEIQPGILKCLPGTPIVRHSESHVMRYSPEPPYEVIETAALPAAELSKIKNFARFWEMIVNRNPFPDLLPRLLPPEAPAFEKFMDISGKLLERFGRNWGIDRATLKETLIEFF